MNTNQTVTLFIQCLVDGIFPEVGEAVVGIFRKLGVSLTCPTRQTCCGQPAFNSGYQGEARLAARRFIEIFQTAETIVCPSGSCVTMVRHHYPQLPRGWMRLYRQHVLTPAVGVNRTHALSNAF